MADFSPQDKRRMTFLNIFATLDGDYDAAHKVVEQLEEDGYLGGKSEAPSRGRSGRSEKRDSGSRRSNRGSGGGGNMRDPGGPPTEKQVATVLKNTDEYTEDEVWDMSKEDVSNIIEDLFNN